MPATSVGFFVIFFLLLRLASLFSLRLWFFSYTVGRSCKRAHRKQAALDALAIWLRLFYEHAKGGEGDKLMLISETRR